MDRHKEQDRLGPAKGDANITISLCIVTNRIDRQLEQLLIVSAPHFHEILIGYNGPELNNANYYAKLYHARIIPVQWEGYGTTKNKLAAMAGNDWICSLDGDEVPDAQLLKEIARLQANEAQAGTIYSFRRVSFFEGRMIRHGAWGRDRVRRIYNRRFTQWQTDPVHETLQSGTTTQTVQLKGKLYHYTADDATAFIEKNRHYALLSAEKYFRKGKKSPLYKRVFSPLFTFIKEYFFQLGFLDGWAGLRIARINALYTYWKYRFLKDKINNLQLPSV